MALATQFDIFEDIAVTDLREKIATLEAKMAKLEESHRATQKCLFGKNKDTELQVQICRDFMEVFGTSLVDTRNRLEQLEGNELSE